MARKKQIKFGAGEKGQNLNDVSNFSAPTTSYPITFGKGPWDTSVFVKIIAENDNKVRFVWDVDNTNSGAIYAGDQLVSSKILDIITNAENGEPATEVSVKFIDIDGTIKETSFGVIDASTLGELETHVQKLENWASGNVLMDGRATNRVSENNVDGFNNYRIDVNVDSSTIDIVENKLTGLEYQIFGVDSQDVSDGFSGQYQLKVRKPGSNNWVEVGERINIFKDFFLKDAHVCTFSKQLKDSGEVVDWSADSGDPIDGLGDVYAILPESDQDYKDAEGYIVDEETGDHITVYLEKAPEGKGLKLDHTYLHLIVNTKDNDEIDPEGNDTTTDVYLDFTEIMGAGAMSELVEQVTDISTALLDVSTRVSEIETSYIKEIDIPDSVDGEQFKTITVVDGQDTSTSFDIPDQAYYDMVADNFETLETDCSTFANSLTWKPLFDEP